MIWRLLFSGAPFIVVAAAVLAVNLGGCAAVQTAAELAVDCALTKGPCGH